MSPDQVKGKPVDVRSDIFSLGVILYELMTGEKPFPGQNITTVIYKIINEEPIPPRSLDSSIHPGLSAVISRALSKDPAGRYQSCHELLTALKSYHEMTSADATVRMAASSTQVLPKANRPVAQVPRVPAAPVVAAPQAPEPSAPVMLSVPVDDEPAKKPGGLLLTLVLLGIIGYSGYRVYAPLMDLYTRAHEAVQTRHSTPAKPELAPRAPNVDSSGAEPETQSNDNAQQPAAPVAPSSSAPEQNTNQRNAPQPKAVSASPAKSPELSPATAGSPDKPIAPSKPAVPAGPSPTHLFETKLRGELAGQPLADKVKMQATANALTLSGSLTLAEHRQLLDHLRAVPAGVRVIDDTEFSEDSKANRSQ
jgi:serine/threonine-protein kinase